mgnify:CR=1 FL=1
MGVVPDAAVRLVDNQTVRRKTAVRLFKAPFHIIGLIVKGGLPGIVESPPRFIGHLPGGDPGGVAIRQLPETLEKKTFLLGNASFRPLRREARVVQTVRLRFDPAGFAIFQTEIRRRTPINFRTVLRKPRLPLFRLQIRPVERKRRQIERIRKEVPVGFVLFGGPEFLQHEQIRPVFEIVCFLTHLHMDSGNGSAFRITEVQNGQTLSVCLDSGSDPVLQEILFFLKRLQNISSTAHCSHPLLI